MGMCGGVKCVGVCRGLVCGGWLSLGVWRVSCHKCVFRLC